eukprot:4446239-Prorocentrum_lima.AAC.1
MEGVDDFFKAEPGAVQSEAEDGQSAAEDDDEQALEQMFFDPPAPLPDREAAAPTPQPAPPTPPL